MSAPVSVAKRARLTQEYLRKILRFDDATNRFFWRGGVKRGVREGMPAGTYCDKYAFIRIDGYVYKIHHLIWFWKTGAWPPHFLDHRDLSTKNNDPANLRPATRSQNNANRRCRPNSTGFKGVYRCCSKFVACIAMDGKVKKLGRFRTAEEAHAAYCAAATERFGEFARFA